MYKHLGRPMARPLRDVMLAVSGCLAMALGAHAMTMQEAFQAAVRNDAQYRAAGHELASAQFAVPAARAALLPQISLNASGSDVVGSRSFPNAAAQDVTVRVDYAAPQASLALRMPIFNYEALSRYRQSEAQSEAATAVYRARGTELIDRLSAAYLQVLLADEARDLSKAQVQMLTVQVAQAKQRLQRGEGTRVDAAQTQANLDVARTRQIEAEDQFELARRQLQRITGLQTAPLRRVPANYSPSPLEPERLGDWLSLAIAQSPSLQAREQALTVARMGVQRNLAGHMPRLDLVASVSRSQNDMVSSLNQTSTLRSIGVQLNVPLYSGGGVDASVKQALADQARAEEDIRSERENLAIEVQRHYQFVVNGASKISAYRQAVESSALALQGARRSLEAGLGTNNDVADAQARYFSAQRDLAQTRIEYLQSRLRLMLQAGMAMADVVGDIDRILVAEPSSATSTTP